MRHQMKGVCAAALLSALPGLAAAQDSPAAQTQDASVIDDVVVTARRREERLSDVPVAASVLTDQTLSDRGGVSSALDLLSGQAGVRFFNTSSPVNSEISIRASPTARATSADPSVGLYRDGAYIGGGAVGGRSYNRNDLFDIGRVEILRGTQGALYGRNAVGGAINIIAQEPVFSNTGFVDFKYGVENESPQVQAVANLVVNENIAVRVGADYIDQQGGFFYNPQNDVYFDRQNTLGVRGQIRYRDDGTDVTFLAERLEGDIPAITYRVVIAPQPAFPHGVTQPEYEYPWSLAPAATLDFSAATLRYQRDFGSAILSSTTAWRERKSYYQFDADGTNPTTLAADRAAGLVLIPIDAAANSLVGDTSTIFNQDVHLTGLAAQDRLSWLIGAEYYSLESESYNTNLRTPTLANPSTGLRSPVLLEYKSWAVYGSLGYDLSEAFNLSVEARYTSDEKSIEARRFDAGTGLAVGGSQFSFDAETSPDNVSYNIIASYDLNEDLLAYAKVGSSYRSGGFNANLGVPQQPVPVVAAYDDETSDAIEIGLKGNLGRHLNFGLAAYRNQTENLIVQTDNGCFIGLPVCSLNAVSFLTNAGEAESTGIELETNTRFDFAGGVLRLGVNVSAQDGEITAGIYDGQPLAQVPDWIYGADLNWARPVFGNSELRLNVNYNGQTGGLQELVRPGSVTPNYDLPDIDILNARLALQVGDIEYSVFGTNISDSTFTIFASPTTQRLNQPRNFGFQVRYRW